MRSSSIAIRPCRVHGAYPWDAEHEKGQGEAQVTVGGPILPPANGDNERPKP
jgi:hypothetical protein